MLADGSETFVRNGQSGGTGDTYDREPAFTQRGSDCGNGIVDKHINRVILKIGRTLRSQVHRSALVVHMAASPQLVFGVATFQAQPGLLVALLVKIMQQGGIRLWGQLVRQLVDLRKEGRKVRLRIGGANGCDRVFEVEQSV